MKGIVFTEFIDLVEEHFNPDIADGMITAAALPNQGAYTSVGTYPHTEMVRMVAELSRLTEMPAPHLINLFGRHLAGRFVKLFPEFFEQQPQLFDFLASIDSHIHVEVHKLYPDAELPSFEMESRDARRMTLLYRSQRCFEDLAEGLILGCAQHYGEPVRVRREPCGAGTRFVIEHDAAAH